MTRRLLGLSVLVIAGAAGAPRAPAATTIACSAKAVAPVLRDQVRSFSAAEDNRGGVGVLRCTDFTGDGTRDVLYTINSGGTGVAFEWGLIAADGDAPRVVTTGGGGSKLAIARLGSRAQVANPIYRSGDANCCPSGGARIRTFRWNGTRLVLISTRKVKRLPSRF